MSDKPDFEALRKARDETMQKVISELAEKHGWAAPVVHANYGGGSSACYCACADGGPCEHEFDGWEDIEDDEGNVCGGQQICKRCGTGAMSHSMSTCWD